MLLIFLNKNGILLAIVCLLFAACGQKQNNAKGGNNNGKRAASKLDGYIAKVAPYAEIIEVPGTIVANEATEIHPEVSGRIVQLNIAEGKVVSKGTLLAKIYDGDLQAQLKKLQSQLAIAQSNEERAAQLLKIQAISRSDYDAVLLNLNNIQADIDVVKTDIQKTEVRAPFSGKIGLKNISPGTYVTPSTVIATINQVEELKLDFSIPEKYIGNIENGQMVHFTVQGSSETYTAKIYATSANVTLNSRTLDVRAKIVGNTAGLVPGAFAKIRIELASRNVIFVPSQAVIPTIKGKQVIVYREGKAVFTEVELSGRDSARVAVERGLKEGDTIVVSGVMSTKPDSKIEIGRIVY
jgi:RND family efflux transporter, MFP subunit